MARPSKLKLEEGYLRSLWEEIVDNERENNAVVTVTLYATTQRGVFTVEMRALEMMVLNNDQPVSHTVTKRIPDGGSLPFSGALWDLARKLNDMVCQARQFRAQASYVKGQRPK
jgi:hypothetical protein